MQTQRRVPVERLRTNDVVEAIWHGPRGIVVDADRRGWTIVQYGSSEPISYEHGLEAVYLIEEGKP